jgi:hypothetical protein
MSNADMPAMPNELHKNRAMNGLTKREYFAGLAMQGLCASDVEWQRKSSVIARNAVIQADALLEELERTK